MQSSSTCSGMEQQGDKLLLDASWTSAKWRRATWIRPGEVAQAMQTGARSLFRTISHDTFADYYYCY